MTVDTDLVIVGFATLWFAPYTDGVPEPPPADTIDTGEDWAGNWDAIGGTQQGVKITVNPKTIDITIEEQRTPADVLTDTLDIAVATTLSEDTLANMKLAYGGGTITTQSPTGSLIGKSTLTLADSLEKLTIGFEAVNSFGKWRRVYIPKVIAAASVDTSYRRAAMQRLYPVNFRALCDPTEVQITEKTAEHS